MSDQNSRLVYSTGGAVHKKEKPTKRDFHVAAGPSRKGVVVRLDRKGRGGKSVTIIEGLQISLNEIEKLLKRLKARLGTGGTLKDGLLEIQGNHCETVMAELTRIGCKPKRSGG